MKARWKIILVLAGIILLSGLAGAKIGARIAYRNFRRHNNPESWNETALHTLDRQLALTPGQHLKIQALMDARVDELKTLREETVGRTNTIIEGLITQIDQELTPEQRIEFNKLKEQREATTLDTLKVEPRKR
jgi:Spy/CpxP family protein refolding chaperone